MTLSSQPGERQADSFAEFPYSAVKVRFTVASDPAFGSSKTLLGTDRRTIRAMRRSLKRKDHASNHQGFSLRSRGFSVDILLILRWLPGWLGVGQHASLLADPSQSTSTYFLLYRTLWGGAFRFRPRIAPDENTSAEPFAFEPRIALW